MITEQIREYAEADLKTTYRLVMVGFLFLVNTESVSETRPNHQLSFTSPSSALTV